MKLEWFKPRGYRHFDSQVGESFARKAMKAAFVTKHSFSPLLHYSKIEKRYKKDAGTGVRSVVEKSRPIKYASHMDACILSYYAHLLNVALGERYAALGVNENVIAYRALGRGNYHFAADVLNFARANSPVAILAFDVTGFFDNLDHSLLKMRLKSVLKVKELPDDWFKVFRCITQFHFVELEELKKHPIFATRLAENSRDRIASLEELKAEGIRFHPNPEFAKGNRRGIPQGTPISAAISNLYMLEFDASARSFCDSIGAIYRRYSDDILVICKPGDSLVAEAKIMSLIKNQKLEIAPHKTEKTVFDLSAGISRKTKAAQYLGFTFDEGGPAIRESSLSRQWRKMRRAMKRTRKIAIAKIAAGLSDKVHTKRLFRRFSHLKVYDGVSIRSVRNFSSYCRQ